MGPKEAFRARKEHGVLVLADFANQSTGGFVGPISGGLFLTNATRHEQLLGPFQTVMIDLGLIVGPSFEFSYSPDRRVFIGSVTYGFGLGAAFTTMQTTRA